MQPVTRVKWFLRPIQNYGTLRVLTGTVWLLLVYGIGRLMIDRMPGKSVWVSVVAELIVVLVVIAAYRWFIGLSEQRPAHEAAFDGALKELSLGALLGTVMMCAIIGMLWLMGMYEVVGANPWPTLLSPLAFATATALFEEAVFRGLLFRILWERRGIGQALLISSAFFGVAHLGNPNATLWAAIAIAIEAGLLLGIAYLVTRRLWFATGIHLAWNFVQGGIFGVAVSGASSEGLLISRLSGPDILTGGAFGVEASVLAIVVCLATSLALMRRAMRRSSLSLH